MNLHSAEHRDLALNECIDQCTQTHAVCLETIQHCLARGGVLADPDYLAHMSTCADMCATSANAMLRGATIHIVICGACVEVCRECADECAEFAADPALQRCIDACLSCAESCEAMTRG